MLQLFDVSKINFSCTPSQKSAGKCIPLKEGNEPGKAKIRNLERRDSTQQTDQKTLEDGERPQGTHCVDTGTG